MDALKTILMALSRTASRFRVLVEAAKGKPGRSAAAYNASIEIGACVDAASSLGTFAERSGHPKTGLKTGSAILNPFSSLSTAGTPLQRGKVILADAASVYAGNASEHLIKGPVSLQTDNFLLTNYYIKYLSDTFCLRFSCLGIWYSCVDEIGGSLSRSRPTIHERSIARRHVKFKVTH